MKLAAHLRQHARSASFPTFSRKLFPGLALAGLLVLPGLSRADQRDPRLPELFEQLRSAPDAQTANQIAGTIWNIWIEVDSEPLAELMRAGSEAIDRSRPDVAVQIFSELIERAPEFSEAWNKRATAYFQLGDYERSIRDVEVVLKLEPRHFAALSGMGLMYLNLEAEAPAMRWFERSLEVHPFLGGIREQVEKLRERLDGGGI